MQADKRRVPMLEVAVRASVMEAINEGLNAQNYSYEDLVDRATLRLMRVFGDLDIVDAKP